MMPPLDDTSFAFVRLFDELSRDRCLRPSRFVLLGGEALEKTE